MNSSPPAFASSSNAEDQLSRSQILEVLHRRDAVLMATSFAAARFLGGDWQEHLDAVLKALGEGADVSRVYLFQNRLGPDAECHSSQVAEWCAPGVAAFAGNPYVSDLTLLQTPLTRWETVLSAGEIIAGHVADLPEAEKKALSGRGACSIVVVPIFCATQWWGFVGYDECRAPREWEASEIEALRLFGDLLGAAVGRQRADESLRASERNLRAVLGAMRDALIIVDRDGRYCDIPSLDRGLLWRPVEDLIGKTFFDVFSPERAGEFLGYVRRALDTGRTVHATYAMAINGEEVWFDATVSRLDSERVLWVARDVSEQQRAQTRIFQQTRDLETLFEALPDLYFRYDASGVILDYKAPDESLLYLPPARFLGKRVQEILPAETAKLFDEAIARLTREGGPFDIEYELPAGGENRSFEARLWKAPRGEINVVVRDISERKAAERALRERETLYRLLAENSIDIIVRYSADCEALYISPACEAILGFQPHELMGKNQFKFIHPDDADTLVEALQRTKEHGGSETAVYRRLRKDGSFIWLEATIRALFGKDGEVREYQAVLRDVTLRRAAEEALRLAEAKYRSIFDNAIEGIFQTTPEGHYVDANQSLARIYGYDSPREVVEKVTDARTQLYVNPARRAEFVEEMAQNGAVRDFEAQIYRKNGETIWTSTNARAVKDEKGRLLFYEGTVEDISKRKVAEEQLVYEALHDRLTGLSNRALFMDRLSQAFARLRRTPGSLFAVLFLDFDRFKSINDSLGHLVGDQLLVQIARRLESCLRPGDTVARLGGDEFAILLEDIREVEGATIIAERIQIEMRAPFALAGQQVFSSASIGIALAHAQYENPEDLLRDADMAMYRAKGMGRARHEVFDAGMHTRAVALLQLETDLRFAIERNEFRAFYQPIVALKSGEICGFEALLRWEHPERGLVTPGEFIPVAEETGWIVPIGLWILEEACRQAVRWREQAQSENLWVAVNLSVKQFGQNDLAARIGAILKQTGLPPRALKLEITETSLMDASSDVTARLEELAKLGLNLGLDDFGTGYSSLSYLHRYPLESLKIDRSFIAGLGTGENHEIVRTITTLGQNLGLRVVAEGVETPEQLAKLREMGCDNGQGFFFARPLPREAAEKLLLAGQIW